MTKDTLSPFSKVEINGSGNNQSALLVVDPAQASILAQKGTIMSIVDNIRETGLTATPVQHGNEVGLRVKGADIPNKLATAAEKAKISMPQSEQPAISPPKTVSHSTPLTAPATPPVAGIPPQTIKR
ncbi:MAG: hypothetical protein MK052_10430 [Alphaproteobacteria bacterium]|nr:hypothetical protein [Alphaproteobacteria bacterium]